jgi:hypothetical protein
MSTFAGKWQTTFGPMELAQDGKRVRGSYAYMGTECAVTGRIVGARLVFKYREPTIHGEGWFALTRRGKAFAGQYRPQGAERWGSWEGERIGFDGLWNASFGLLRLVEEGDRVHGYYETNGAATIEGRRDGDRLTFTYREPRLRGRGRFELAADGLSFQGEWRPHGAKDWRPWSGIRVRPQPNRTYLVVIEAPWQRWLGEPEYSFGSMLRAFFARVSHVEVRHRFFTNEAGLRKCCRDLLYIAEPVVLLLATHGRPDGIPVDGQTIGVRALAEALQYTGDLRLLHFSACLMLQDPEVVSFLREFAAGARLPISGYTTSVDWAASAIIEFTYLDLILSKGLTPAAAAEQLPKLLPFAGDKELDGATYHPAGFTMVTPEGKRRRRRIAAREATLCVISPQKTRLMPR